MGSTGSVFLEFDPEHSLIAKGKLLRDGLSVVVQVGNALWLANDETASLERLTLAGPGTPGAGLHAGGHRQFPLEHYLDLPAPPTPEAAKPEEVDVEGLAWDQGYLWLVGSHSLKRKRPSAKGGTEKALRQLARVSSDPNRYLLARIPLVAEAGGHVLARRDAASGRVAGQLRGDGRGNDLTRALRQDEHLAPFLAIPGKDNGFDIEGLAVLGKRLFLGLRGPVLRGWAVILEVEPRDAAGNPSVLELVDIGPAGRPYRKHFIDLDGLGIRDLCVQGSDLLILAGPTMDLDGPVAVFRWRGGARPDAETLVEAGHLERLLEVR